jgi:UDP-N-acetyl-D-mannosaminuronic acid dehydrogenase
MMLAHYYGCDFETIRQAINKNYPRMNLYGAGAAAGPCLAKDGQFMVAHVPYPEMIRTASVVNEALPAWIFKQLKDTLVSKVAILGMTFKADNDDTRHSLSFKLKKILTREGYDVVCYDRYVPEYSDVSVLESCGAYVLMTPHSYFDDEFYDNHIASQSVIIDVWKHFPRSKISADYNINGIYYKVEPNEF